MTLLIEGRVRRKCTDGVRSFSNPVGVVNPFDSNKPGLGFNVTRLIGNHDWINAMGINQYHPFSQYVH